MIGSVGQPFPSLAMETIPPPMVRFAIAIFTCQPGENPWAADVTAVTMLLTLVSDGFCMVAVPPVPTVGSTEWYPILKVDGSIMEIATAFTRFCEDGVTPAMAMTVPSVIAFGAVVTMVRVV